MGVSICTCKKCEEGSLLPYTNLYLQNNANINIKSNTSQINPLSIHNNNIINKQNELLDQNKNKNINIINNNNNNNKENYYSKNYSSNNYNSTCLNNIDTIKVIDNLKFHKKEIVQEESDEKDNEEEQEQEEQSDEIKLDPELEEKKINAIKDFDEKIIEYAEYITEEKFSEYEKNNIINKLEESLDKISIKSSNNFIKCFARPPLLFKSDKSLYKGSWNFKGQKEGFGIFIDSQGNKFIGEWKNDKFEGKGRIFSINGDCYEGDFICGQMHGHGMFICRVGGYSYLGEFKNNKFDGRGKLIYDDNTKYEGDFSEGYMHGEGNLIFKDGSCYKGLFDKNCFHGKGKFTFHDGRKYNGDWKNNAMDGRGIFTWDEHIKYNGNYVQNIKEGNGVYSFGANLYDGQWVNNMPYGEGILLNDGMRIVGLFRHGKLIGMREGKGVNREISQKLTMTHSSYNNNNKNDTFSDKNDFKKRIQKYNSENNNLKNKLKDNSKYSKDSKFFEQYKENKKHKSKKKK